VTRARTISIVRIVVAVAVVVALVWGVARNWTEISQDLRRTRGVRHLGCAGRDHLAGLCGANGTDIGHNWGTCGTR
jgi:hypothetical protein